MKQLSIIRNLILKAEHEWLDFTNIDCKPKVIYLNRPAMCLLKQEEINLELHILPLTQEHIEIVNSLKKMKKYKNRVIITGIMSKYLSYESLKNVSGDDYIFPLIIIYEQKCVTQYGIYNKTAFLSILSNTHEILDIHHAKWG